MVAYSAPVMAAWKAAGSADLKVEQKVVDSVG